MPFRFIFCEKVHLSETHVTLVYLTDHMSAFHSLISPASSFCRDATGMLIHDLFSLRDKRHSNFIPPESLMLFEEFPLIANAADNTSSNPEPYSALFAA